MPEGDLRRYYELAMDGIAESDVAIEVSTAGLRKPVGEIYPAPAFLEMCLEAGAPVALSTTPTRPSSLAPLRAARSSCWRARRDEIAVFERRERRLEPLDDR